MESAYHIHMESMMPVYINMKKFAHTFFKLLQYCLSYLLVHLLGANKTTWRLHEIFISDFYKLDFFKRTFC